MFFRFNNRYLKKLGRLRKRSQRWAKWFLMVFFVLALMIGISLAQKVALSSNSPEGWERLMDVCENPHKYPLSIEGEALLFRLLSQHGQYAKSHQLRHLNRINFDTRIAPTSAPKSHQLRQVASRPWASARTLHSNMSQGDERNHGSKWSRSQIADDKIPRNPTSA